MLYGQLKRRTYGKTLKVLILIFLENALRLVKEGIFPSVESLNPYFFGKCSTACNKNQ